MSSTERKSERLTNKSGVAYAQNCICYFIRLVKSYFIDGKMSYKIRLTFCCQHSREKEVSQRKYKFCTKIAFLIFIHLGYNSFNIYNTIGTSVAEREKN